ncbi:MAG: lyase domain protein repeat-containing protein [Actinomycetia bacterium]|nr:lyase domain protein repeat-containing protein [Actinomycetes bacterium]
MTGLKRWTADHDPLSGLERVDWVNLHHAYGGADDVPAQLKALLSNKSEDRRQARHELTGNIYHQGTRWQASSHVVPFLAALVDHRETPDRPAVLSVLRAVALGDRDDTALPFDARREFAAAEAVTDRDIASMLDWLYGGGAEDGNEAEEIERAVVVAWDRDAYLAAAAVADRFVAWTGDPDPMVAAQAAELIAWFPGTDDAIAALIAIPETGDRAVVRASANLTLAYLSASSPGIDQRLVCLLTAASYSVRLTAAVAVALRLDNRMPEAALGILIEARDHAVDLTSERFPLPWERSLIGFASIALYQVGLAP